MRLLTREPRIVYDRLRTGASIRYERLSNPRSVYEAVSWENALRELECYIGPVAEVADEPELRDVEAQVQQWLANADLNRAPFPIEFNADPCLARLCYIACRLLKPTVVIETGVAYGVTSAFILKALEKNDRDGTLHSIDLPPLEGGSANQFVGAAVPEYLRRRWVLHLGASKRILPKLLKRIKKVDLFVHDSLHTYRNMRREFEMVLPYLGRGSMIIADDVGNNPAFKELQQNMRFWLPIRGTEEIAPFGVALK